MYNDRIFLTPKEILEKDFKIDARGYRPQEVDKFLDMVIRDYTEFANIIKKYELDLKNLNDDNGKLKAELRKIKEELEAKPNGEASPSNVDLLRRISQLEKVVFGEKE
jgi:DivIVA domain-containing protein